MKSFNIVLLLGGIALTACTTKSLGPGETSGSPTTAQNSQQGSQQIAGQPSGGAAETIASQTLVTDPTASNIAACHTAGFYYPLSECQANLESNNSCAIVTVAAPSPQAPWVCYQIHSLSVPTPSPTPPDHHVPIVH